ncbi:MAG: RimK/LysX family protein [Actinobacteria bacterium]|nr:RimK/LysX family protein [Actinomycetota bacterium]
MSDELPVLGWKEHVSLPDWGIPRLRAKLDTGARTSALHVEDDEVIDEHEHEGQILPVVTFHVLVGSRETPTRHEVEAPVVGYKVVRDTGGKAQRRPVVRTRIVIGPLDTEADVTLTTRHGMNFRMLIGRLTMEDRCLVDPARGYLRTSPPPAPR